MTIRNSGFATVEATPNIAVVKYWGKRDDKLILPMNSSQSFTLAELRTRTSVMFSPDLTEDELWINAQKVDLTNSEAKERMQLLDVVRQKAGIKHKARIVSINSFPTAAGFASSASGLAALAVASAAAAGLKLSSKELSILARLGSGSACRSVLGGFVEWKKGSKPDGSDSFARRLAKADHWPELRLVSVVVDAGKKKVSSRAGMKQTIATSALYASRQKYVPGLLKAMKEAVLAKDFPKFAELTMRESSNMHAVMLDTWPPITYLNDVSRDIMYSVAEFNATGGVRAAYTFDAGPNAHIYCLEKDVAAIQQLVGGLEGVRKTFVSTVGKGPRLLKGAKDHLINPDTGDVREHHYDEANNTIVVKA